MGDAITSLREDHRRVEKLFKEFEKLEKNDGSAKQKRAVVEEIIGELAEHAWIEEQVFYPEVRAQVDEAEDVVLEGLEEHHIVKWTLSELDGMKGDEERFDAKMKVLMESVRHHVEEEEGEMFPQVREVIKRKGLVELGERMDAARGQAPHTPQPTAPDEPTGEPLTEPVTDRSKDKGGLLGLRRQKSGAKT